MTEPQRDGGGEADGEGSLSRGESSSVMWGTVRGKNENGRVVLAAEAPFVFIGCAKGFISSPNEAWAARASPHG